MPKRSRDQELTSPRAPLGRRRLDFTRLNEDEFELLCFYVIAIEFPEVVRVANPDGGADAVLPRSDRSWARCWQSKRYTAQIKWKECRDSFDAGVENYSMPHYTFCFARDLTKPQEDLFKQHLVGRHKGVVVDHWSASRIEAALFASDQGKRIAAEFFGDPEGDTRALARAMRAAGELSTGAKVVDRLAAIAEHLHQHDPFYTYVTVTAEPGSPRPGPTPQAVLALETVEDGTLVRIEAVPRPSTLPEQLPGGTVFMTPAQAGQFERFLTRGGDIELERVRVDFHNLPRALEGLGPSGEEMTVTMRAPTQLPPPWHARFSLITPGLEVKPAVFHLQPTLEVPSDWDAALTGKYGALSATVLLRQREDRGQMMVQWSYKDDLAVPTRVRADQLNFVEGLHRQGKLVIEDVSGARPRLEFDTTDRELDASFQTLRMLLFDLVAIENWMGREYRLAEGVPAREVRAIHEMANIIRRGESSMNFERAVLRMPREKADEVLNAEGDNQFLFEVGVGLAVLNTEIPIGALRGTVRDVKATVAETDEPGFVDMVLEPATEEAAHPTFQLVRS